MKKLVVFTGAGVSADSGLATFRDSDGTWGNYRIEEVCIPEALDFNRRGVIRFYNERRAEMLKAEPNAAHRAIAGLERDFDVRVITQNVDNLHERAGSTHILHLHGELTKLRSTDDPSLIGASTASLRVMLSSYVFTVPALVLFNVVSGAGNTRSALFLEFAALCVYSVYMVGIVIVHRADVAVCWTTEHVYAIALLVFVSIYLARANWKNKAI